MTPVTVKGEARKVRYRAESGFTILSAQIENSDGRDDDATLVGMMPPLEPGDRFDAEVVLEEHAEYGYQYRVTNLMLRVDGSDMTEEGVAAYLEARVAGVGPKLSKRIAGFFGTRTFEVIESDPERLLQVPGVTQATLHKIVSSWDERHLERRVITALQSLGLSVSQAQRAMKHFGSSAPEQLKNDIYSLTEVEGIGFLTADRIAQGQGMPLNDPRRLAAAAVYALQQAQISGGHSYLPRTRTVKGIMHYGGVPAEQAEAALEDAALFGRVREDEGRIYLPPTLRTEKKLSGLIADLLLTEPDEEWRVPANAARGLSDDQARVLELLSDHRLVVLTGGPGTGKSYTTRAVCDLAEKLGLEVALCAPTGKAARRLGELTGRTASTIHRLLGYGPDGFRFGPGEALYFDLIVVDEVSMCGDALMLSLLSALAPGTRILLVGDADQLPPVDYGMPLETLTAVAPTVRLGRVYRQAETSPIVRAAHAVLHGEAPDFAHPDLRLVEVEADVGARRVALMVRELGGPQRVQVLSPMRKGPLGVSALNEALQRTFNPGEGGVRVGDYLIRTGDVVVQTKNDYQNEVFNGTLGTVLEERGGKLVIDFEGNVVELGPPELWNLQLGYALTVHRSQGSEWPVVVGVLHDTHYNMLSRELAYTALTRAARTFIGVGSRRAWEVAASRRRELRYSHLLERVRERL
ncbi:exodeoxyribonuclease V alpha subunit [Deinobacterium chartae]|uniref:ATP-dependent RecD2 DNA helicase n=1 Tax=Deinobacterium chartae TaxID=521158 RepID=A0A841I4C1_9DEIO|nr:exodeoxyribonuclease V alpha subunit [Deinobacterium chartae]